MRETESARPKRREKFSETGFSFFGLGSRAREHVAHAADRLDVVSVLLGVTKLAAHFADVHIDAAIERHELATEHGVDQALPGDDASGFAQQDFQKIELDRCQ